MINFGRLGGGQGLKQHSHTAQVSDGGRINYVTLHERSSAAPTPAALDINGYASDFDERLYLINSAGISRRWDFDPSLDLQFLNTADLNVTADKNNYDPWTESGIVGANNFFLTPTAARNITGILDGIAPGVSVPNYLSYYILITNDPASGFNLTLKHLSASSSTRNRIYCPNGVDLVLAPADSAVLIQTDGNAGGGGRWFVIATSVASTVSSTAGPDANVTVDAAGAAGTAGTFARSQHGHRVNSTAGPDADITIDAAGAAGTSGTLARSAHGHKLTTYSSAATQITGAAGAAGTSGTAPSRGDHSHQGYILTEIAPSINANQDNWNPAGLAPGVVIRPNLNGANRTITGIVAQTNGAIIYLKTGGANTIILAHLTTSSAANQISCPGAVNYTITDRAGVALYYSATGGHWEFLDK